MASKQALSRNARALAERLRRRRFKRWLRRHNRRVVKQAEPHRHRFISHEPGIRPECACGAFEPEEGGERDG